MPGSDHFSTDRFRLKVALFYGAYFLSSGVQLPFFPLWLEAKGLDPRTIGLVIAAPIVMRFVATPILAHQADRWQAPKAVLVIASCCAALGMAIVSQMQGAAAILIAVCAAAFFFSPLLAIVDSYALAGLRRRSAAYGPVRLWGSAAFMVGNVVAGVALAVLAPIDLIWLIVAPLALAVIAAAMLSPSEPVEKPALGTAAGAYRLRRDRGFVLVAAAVALIQGSHALYYGFSTVEWRAAGFSGLSIGVLWSIGVFAEIVLFALSSRLPGALTPTRLMSIGASIAVVRWSVMAFDPPAVMLPALQLLHAGSFAATHLGAVGFLTRAVPSHLSATAHGTVSTAAGLAMASATVLSGLLYEASGPAAYALMAAMALAGLGLALAAHRKGRG